MFNIGRSTIALTLRSQPEFEASPDKNDNNKQRPELSFVEPNCFGRVCYVMLCYALVLPFGRVSLLEFPFYSKNGRMPSDLNGG